MHIDVILKCSFFCRVLFVFSWGSFSYLFGGQQLELSLKYIVALLYLGQFLIFIISSELNYFCFLWLNYCIAVFSSSGFWPSVKVFLYQIPVVGWIIQYPITVSSFDAFSTFRLPLQPFTFATDDFSQCDFCLHEMRASCYLIKFIFGCM